MLVLLFAFVGGNAQTFTVMEYNVENAFDTIHNEGKNDYEYLQEGERKWSRWRLFKKLRNIAKVIAAANEEHPVDLVGLCEVENDTVLTYLTEKTALSNVGYKYVMTYSLDARGIDVALLYSPFTFHPVDIQCFTPDMGEHPTRDILHVAGTVSTGDTLDVFVVHLPSKLGGSAAKRRSMKVTELLKEKVDSVSCDRTKPNVIVMGDFNAEPKSAQLKLLTKAGNSNLATPLFDTSAKLTPGTYKYKGTWSIIDHILTSFTSIKATESSVISLPFLLEKDKTHGGKQPHRTYLGPVYKGGTSDHLPIKLKFSIK